MHIVACAAANGTHSTSPLIVPAAMSKPLPPARVAPRRTWTAPFLRRPGRATQAAVAVAGRVAEALPASVALLSAEEDFLRRLREAGL
jgi:hypothetical protein